MDSRNVWGDFHIYTFQIYKEVQEQMLGACHRSACLSSHLASMARLILCFFTIYTQGRTRGQSSGVPIITLAHTAAHRPIAWRERYSPPHLSQTLPLLQAPPTVVRFSHQGSTDLRDILLWFFLGGGAASGQTSVYSR